VPIEVPTVGIPYGIPTVIKRLLVFFYLL
jgi:hypothetical protein